jgi:hypothetical protein
MKLFVVSSMEIGFASLLGSFVDTSPLPVATNSIWVAPVELARSTTAAIRPVCEDPVRPVFPLDEAV